VKIIHKADGPKLSNFISMNFKEGALLIVLFYMLTLPGYSQEDVRFINYSERLSTGGLLAYNVYQDSRGFLWMGVAGGVSRFDGTRIRNYLHDPFDTSGLHEMTWLSCFAEGEGNIMWIGDQYLTRYDIEQETFTQFRDTMVLQEGNIITCMIKDSTGLLWLGTGEGLASFDVKTEEFKRYSRSDTAFPQFQYPHIESMLQDTKGRLWISTGLGLYYHDRGDSLIHHQIIALQDSPDVKGRLFKSDMSQDNEGIIWMLAGMGLSKYDPTTGFITLISPESDFAIQGSGGDVIAGSDGKIWFGLQQGLMQYDPELDSIIRYDEPEGPIDHINQDANGNLLLGTRFGLVIFDPGEPMISTYPKEVIIGNIDEVDDIMHYLLDVCRDMNGDYWISLYGQGLIRMDPRTGHKTYYPAVIEPPYDFYSHKVTEIHSDKSGRLWFSSYLNLALYREETDDFRLFPLSHPALTTMDREGFIWIRGNREFIRFNTETFDTIHYALEEDIDLGSELWFDGFCADTNGGLWLDVPEGGILKFLPESGHSVLYSHDPSNLDGLISNDARALFCDSKNRIWAGTQWGVSRIIPVPGTDSIFIKNYTVRDGLLDNSCHRICEDHEGNIWLGGSTGISVLNPENEKIVHVNAKGNLDGLVMSMKSYPDGVLVAGGRDVTFIPGIRQNFYQPPVHITDFKIFDESLIPGENSPLSRSLIFTDRVDLKHNENFISIEFSALNYRHPEKNQYRYFLEGIDRDTIWADTESFAEYTNLPPGRYTFWVSGSNDTDVWNPIGRTLEIRIHPPWYRSMLAYIIYVILLGMGIYFYIRWRTWNLRREKEVLEVEVKKRTTQISDQNEELKQQKEEIVSSNEELMGQREELQITLENLQATQTQLIQSEKLAALGGLVAGVAHEINTPVGISVTAASSLAEETQQMAEKYKANKISRTEFKEYLNTTNQSAKLILSNMERAATLVQSFKQVSVDQNTEQKRKFKLKAYSEDVIRSLYPKLKGKKIDISIDIDDKLELDNYPGAYSQVLTNLVLNSLVHGFQGRNAGIIKLSARVENTGLILEYSDNGKGIRKESIPKIFDPFFTTDKTAGTGLGLHIVYNLVDQKLGGKINCESQLNAGTKFYLEIPI